MAEPQSLKNLVARQSARVLEKGSRLSSFDRLRTRHFWSKYLFAVGAGGVIAAGPYDIFKVIPSGVGQGYPGGVPLTLRETNWRNSGRVPDNQNFVIAEVGVSVTRPPAITLDNSGDPVAIPSGSIFGALSPAIQALIDPSLPVNSADTAAILSNGTLEMQYLTNTVPMGLLGDFSQSAGQISYEATPTASGVGMGDMKNGIPAAKYRRKFEVPILLQHGESMGMRINFPRPVTLLSLEAGGNGWVEVHVDWWAYESFAEQS